MLPSLPWGYLPEQSREATDDVGRRQGGYPPGWCHGARRALLKEIFDVVANPAPAWLCWCEETFPEG